MQKHFQHFLDKTNTTPIVDLSKIIYYFFQNREIPREANGTWFESRWITALRFSTKIPCFCLQQGLNP